VPHTRALLDRGAAKVYAAVRDPATIPDPAAQTLDAVEAGEPEVLVDDVTREVRAALSGPLSHLHPSIASTGSSSR
jgi:hypothetical protein